MFLADNFRSFAEHSHPESDTLADEHRLITYLSTPFERMLVAPMNMNCHAAHHLWPSIPYYNLEVADREIRGLPEAIGLEWRKSYFGYLFSYRKALPIEGCPAELSNSGHHGF
jgi:fatty acid desaturase